MSELPSVLVSMDPRGVATVTLNRPDRHNAFDDAMIADLLQALRGLKHKQELRALVLAAEGRSFSAGADLAWMQRMCEYDFRENLRDSDALAELMHTLYHLPMPTLARVQGAAFGGGVGLLACCDLVVAAEEARFCFSEVKLGLIPATISPYVLAAIGQRAALRYFMTAERFDAATAKQLGLVAEVVSAENLDGTLGELLSALLHNGPDAVRAAKKLVRDIGGRPIDIHMVEDTSKRIATVRVSEEGQAGLKAFLQKQTPPWQAP